MKKLPDKYELIELGTLGGRTSNPWGINDSEVIVGGAQNSAGKNIGFCWRNGIMTEIDSMESQQGVARNVNNQGHVVGELVWANGTSSAFGWIENELKLFKDPDNWDTSAFAINDSEYVVGWRKPAKFVPPGVIQAVVWRGGVINRRLELGIMTYATSINQSGAIAGASDSFAFVDVGNQVQSIGCGRFEDTKANGLNDLNEVVGSAIDSMNIERAYICKKEGLIEVGTLGGEDSLFHAINNGGCAVGTAALDERDNRGREVRHAIAWKNGELIDLNSRIMGSNGWVVESARCINNAGAIACVGIRNDVRMAVLLRPT